MGEAMGEARCVLGGQAGSGPEQGPGSLGRDLQHHAVVQPFCCRPQLETPSTSPRPRGLRGASTMTRLLFLPQQEKRCRSRALPSPHSPAPSPADAHITAAPLPTQQR